MATATATPEIEELVQLTPEHDGVCRIGEKVYLVTMQDGMDDLTFRHGETTYRVSCWSEQRGNHSCECKDWQFRARKQQRLCRHLRAAFAIRDRLTSELADRHDFGGQWEE